MYKGLSDNRCRYLQTTTVTTYPVFQLFQLSPTRFTVKKLTLISIQSWQCLIIFHYHLLKVFEIEILYDSKKIFWFHWKNFSLPFHSNWGMIVKTRIRITHDLLNLNYSPLILENKRWIISYSHKQASRGKHNIKITTAKIDAVQQVISL